MRRNPGEGTVKEYQTVGGSRYTIEWREPPPGGVGQKIRKSKSGFTSRTEALRTLELITTRVQESVSEPKTLRITLDTLFEGWIVTSRLAKTTLAGYRKNFRLHISPYIGHLPVEEVTPDVLAVLYRKLEEGGHVERDGGRPATPIGPNTVTKVHNQLSALLQYALEATPPLIASNPARSKRANPPRPRQVREAAKLGDVWTVPQMLDCLQWIEENMQGDELRYTYRIVALTGMRRGEVLGLANRDVIYSPQGAPQAFFVNKNLTAVRERGRPTVYHLGATKSGEPRTIYLDAHASQAVQAQREMLLELGKSFLSSTAPFVALRDRAQVTPDLYSKRFASAVRDYNAAHFDQPSKIVPNVTIQGLRHSHATHLLQAGVHPRVVQERFGHSDIRITMRTYSHVVDSVQTQALNTFTALLNATQEPPPPDI